MKVHSIVMLNVDWTIIQLKPVNKTCNTALIAYGEIFKFFSDYTYFLASLTMAARLALRGNSLFNNFVLLFVHSNKESQMTYGTRVQ